MSIYYNNDNDIHNDYSNSCIATYDVLIGVFAVPGTCHQNATASACIGVYTETNHYSIYIAYYCAQTMSWKIAK